MFIWYNVAMRGEKIETLTHFLSLFLLPKTYFANYKQTLRPLSLTLTDRSRFPWVTVLGDFVVEVYTYVTTTRTY